MTYLMRLISRVVLVTYTAQLLAPVAYAMEEPILQVQSTFSKRLDRPSRQEQKLQAGLQKELKSQAALLKGTPTLSIHFDQLPGDSQYRLSISQTRWSTVLSGQRPIQTTDYNWYQDISVHSLKSVIHHPWMQYLKLKLEDSGLLSVQSLQNVSHTSPSGFYGSFHYDFSVATDLKLSNIMTDGTITVRKSQQLYIQETVYGKKGVALQADKRIQTRPLQQDCPTWLGSNVSMTLTTPFLDNAYSTIYAPVVKGVLGNKGQESMCLDNTHGAIQADDLLSLSVTSPVINTQGFMDCRFGTTHVEGDGSLHNDHGQVRGKKQLLLNLTGDIHNQTGHLWSRGKTDIHAKDMESTQGAEVSGHNLTLSIKEALKTDDTSHFKAGDKITIAAQTLDHQSPFKSPTVSIHTIDGISLGAQSLENLTLITEQGPISYPPNGLQASGLLSMTSKNVPLTLTIPLNSPGAFEATAPEVIKNTKMAFKKHITLTGTSTQVDYPVRSVGHLGSGTKGLTVNAQGFSHTCGQLSLAEDFIFAGQNLRLKGVVNIEGTLPITNTGKRDISYTHLHVDGLLQLILPPLQQELTTPLKITGRLELDRQGNSPKPLSLLADLIAKKGIKVRVPSAHVIAGSENAKDLVKLQAEEGLLEIESKSLDIIKAQMFSRTGMKWTTQEKEIHVGRGVTVDAPMMSIFESLCKSPHYEGSSLELFLSSSFLKPHLPNLPFKRSNGTHVVTEGPFTIQSPHGVYVDQSEIHVGQNHDLTITTQKPVRSDGGKINVRNLIINDIRTGNHSGSVFQNTLLLNSVCISPQGAPYNLSYPYCQLPMLIVNGKFVAGRLENSGGFIHITEPLSCQVIEKDMTATCSTPCTAIDFFFSKSGIPTNMNLIYPGSLSAPKGIMNLNAVSPKLGGVIQTSNFVTAFEGRATVGKVVNYRRPETQPFQQLKRFMDLPHSTVMFQPVMNSSLPWINQPTVPLSWGIQLPPAVGFGPEGLYLLDRSDKLLLHPLQEVGDLPCVFNAQLRRGYLDDEHPETLATYIMGRQKAYDLYRKFFASRTIQSHKPETNPERALQALDTTLAASLTEEDIDQLKFMMLYYPMPYDGKMVYLPASWLSKKYDDPRVRNPDGGIFASRIAIFKGKTPHDILHCVSTIHGESLLGIDVAQTILEQQNFSYIAYLTNTTIEEGSWFRSDKIRSQTFALQVSEAQPNTGHLTTGKKGQLAMKGKLNLKNGSQVKAGKYTFDIPEMESSPAVNVSVAHHLSSAGKTSITHHTPVYDIQPARIILEGSAEGKIGTMKNVEALQVISKNGNLDIKVEGDANLLACQRAQSSGLQVSLEDGATVIQEAIHHIAVPCAFLAPNGRVSLIVGGKLYGVAPQFVGKVLNLDAKEMDIDSLLMANQVTTTSKRESNLSNQTTTSLQETLSCVRTLLEGEEIHIKGKRASILGALIKGGVLYDHTQEGLTLGSKVIPLRNRTETQISQPFAETNMGTEGGQEVMVPTTLDLEKVIRVLEGPMKFESVDWDKNKTQVIGDLIETTYQLKRWQTSWNNTEQLIPNEALVVVAFGIALATQGVGVNFLSPLLNNITAVTGMQLSTAGIAAVNAGFSAVCSQFTTSALATGNPLQAAKDLTSTQSLKSIGISMASAGLCSKLGEVWNIDLNPSLKELGKNATKPVFTDFLTSQALKGGVNTGLNVAVNGTDPSEAFTDALKQAPIAAVAAWASYNIGDLGFQGKLTSLEQDMVHSLVGAAYGAVLNPDKPLEGAITGGANAVIAAHGSRALLGNREEIIEQASQVCDERGWAKSEANIQLIANEIIHIKTAIPTILGASLTAAITKDPGLTSTAISVATNVTENNCAVSAMKGIRIPNVGGIPGQVASVASAVLEELLAGLNISDIHEEIGLEGTFLKLVDDGIIQVRTSRTGQTYYLIKDETFDTAEQAWKAFAGMVPFGHSIEEKEWTKGRTLADTFSSTSFTKKVDGLTQQYFMDAAPKNATWKDEGLTIEERKLSTLSTPVHDHDFPQEGFTPVGVLPTLKGYQLPEEMVDTSILNLEITESGRLYGTHKELMKARANDSHHIIQHAAVTNLPDYNRDDAPVIQLQGPSRTIGTEHSLATRIQRESGGGTYGAERRIGYKALRKAGINSSEARKMINNADSYFRGLGVGNDTKTDIPGNRSAKK